MKSKMIRHLWLFSSILILIGLVRPIYSEDVPEAGSSALQVQAAAISADSADPAPYIPSDRLLPEVLSPGERILWGEHGLMRTTGLYPLTEESRMKELSLRRGLLTAHEIGGFVTLGAMITTVVYGQLRLNGDASKGSTHENWATATIFSYFTTAGLSLLSPPPMVRRAGWSTISIHKGLALIHFSGMVLTPLLAEGIAMEERGSGVNRDKIDRDKAHIHQISGYITTVAFASALMVITF